MTSSVVINFNDAGLDFRTPSTGLDFRTPTHDLPAADESMMMMMYSM
jgi:hypothetical protein